MDLIVDGVIYQMQKFGGISRIYNEILPRMCDLEPMLKVNVFTSGLCLQEMPKHKQIKHDPPQTISKRLYPSWFWNPLFEKGINPARKYTRRSSPESIWHSTYYTLPDGWNGWIVATVVDMIQEKLPEIFTDQRNAQVREMKSRCIRRADAIICISESTRQDVLATNNLAPEKVCVIHLSHSLSFRRLESTTGSTAGGQLPFILYVGPRETYKNFATLLRAFRIWKRKKDFTVLAVGHPWSASEKSLLADLGLQDKVRCIGQVNDEELCLLYNQAAAFVYPSLYEGFGIPVLEAMACGCPLAASDIPSTREIAGDLPYYFDPLDAKSLESALDEAVSMDRKHERISKGLARAREFSWQRTARQTLEVYYSLI